MSQTFRRIPGKVWIVRVGGESFNQGLEQRLASSFAESDSLKGPKTPGGSFHQLITVLIKLSKQIQRKQDLKGKLGLFNYCNRNPDI